MFFIVIGAIIVILLIRTVVKTIGNELHDIQDRLSALEARLPKD